MQLTEELKLRKLAELEKSSGFGPTDFDPDVTLEVVKLIAGNILPVPFLF